MARIDDIRQKVAELYAAKDPNRAEWADWIYENHVLVVANNAVKLAEKYGANVELSEVAALLHDIADYKMQRSNPSHEAESLATAHQLMADCGYTAEEVELTIEDAIRFHSCHGDQRPNSKEGLVLATADSLAHLQTDFYVFATSSLSRRLTLPEIKDWVLKKIDRDLFSKISFEDERTAAQPDYDMIKRLYSR